MKIIEQKINDFSLGMTNDLRIGDTRYSKLIRNFDAHTFKNRLVPFRDSESGDASGNANSIQNFAVALRTGTTYSLYGLGRISATDSGVRIFQKELTQTSSDLSDGNWANPSAAQGTTAVAPDYNLFVYYRQVGLIYGAAGGSNIWAFSPTGTAFANAAQALTYTHIGQGLVHSADDRLYIPYYNNAGGAGAKSFIMSKSGAAAFNTTALTLPDHLIPASICEYGNYLAIACYPASGFGKSFVFLWDKNSTSWNECIDWGEGNLFVLEEIDGYLVGITSIGTGSIGGVSFTASMNTTINQRILFRYYSGGKPVVFKEFTSNTSTANLSVRLNKQKVNNYLYFFLAMTFPDGVLREGLWKVGKNQQTGNWSVVLDRGQNNDTDTTSGTLRGFIIVGDFVFIGYISSSTHAVSKTSDTETYTATSIYETIILNDGDSRLKKKLLGVTIYHEPLPSGASIVVKYKIDDTIDDNSSFTTILTNTTLNSVHKTAINIESSGAALPEYKELVLRVESTCTGTGGGIITGLKYRSEITGKDLLD